VRCVATPLAKAAYDAREIRDNDCAESEVCVELIGAAGLREDRWADEGVVKLKNGAERNEDGHREAGENEPPAKASEDEAEPGREHDAQMWAGDGSLSITSA